MKIAFDLDKVFADHPPLVPSRVIEWFYKRKNGHLIYRIPGTFEQKIRVLSHNSYLRPPIQNNINNLSSMAKSAKHEMYLISGRFGFLEDRTKQWIQKHKVQKFFKDLYFNLQNEQPHLYKDKMIKRLKIQKYVDDDLDLLIYLAQKNPKIKFYWLNGSKGKKQMPYPNITQICSLEEFENKYLNN